MLVNILPSNSALAEVAQRKEATVLGTVQYGFESLPRHQYALIAQRKRHCAKDADGVGSNLTESTKALWFALHRGHIKTGRAAKYGRLVGSKGQNTTSPIHGTLVYVRFV